MNSAYTQKLLAVMYHGSMEIIKDTTEAFTTWLDQVFFTLTNILKNVDVQQIQQKKYIDIIYTVN